MSKQYNILLVFSPDEGQVLMCLRRKPPYRGKLNFIGGKIEAGESSETAAYRELWEETGLTLTSIQKILPDSFNCVGITNEKSSVIIGTAEGEFTESTSDEEEIECRWYTREEVRRLVESEAFSARVQMFCYFWSMSDRI